MQGHSLWNYFTTSALVRYLLLFGCGWATIEALNYFEIVVVIFTSATILAFLLSYPVGWLRRFVPHNIAVLVVFLIGLTIIGGIVITISLAVFSQGQPLINNVAEFLSSLAPYMEGLERSLARWNLQIDLQVIGDQIRDQTVSVLSTGVVFFGALLTNFIYGILIAVVTLFMLLDGDRIWQFFISRVPSTHRYRITRTVRESLLSFFWGRLLLSTFFGMATLIAFLIFKMPYALTLALTAGLFDLIPGIGSTIGIGLIMLFLLSQNIGLAIQAVFICVVLQQIEENLLMPRIMRGSLDINPVVMFFALIVGVRVAGILGIFLAIPVASTIVSLLEIDEMKGKSVDSSLLTEDLPEED